MSENMKDFNATQDYRRDAICKVNTRIEEIENAISENDKWYKDHPKPLYCSVCHSNLDYEEIEHRTIELYQICPMCHHKSVIPLCVDVRTL